jgi:hypothetical protein
MDDYALVLNAEPSSLKFCVFQRPDNKVWQVAGRGRRHRCARVHGRHWRELTGDPPPHLQVFFMAGRGFGY